MSRQMREEKGLQIKILVVDDDKAIADILKDLLSDDERSVDVCHDGSTAIESIQKKIYDLIITDLVMPEMGGLDVLKWAKKTNPNVIVIIITGYASLETALQAIKEGAYDYIRKPCKLEEIRIVVENAIDKIMLNRENRELLMKLEGAHNDLLALKSEKHCDGKIANMNFFSSNMPSLHYLYDNDFISNRYVNQLKALSSLKESGILTENEFNAFKDHLLKMMNPK